jgi:hypothetical protein
VSTTDPSPERPRPDEQAAPIDPASTPAQPDTPADPKRKPKAAPSTADQDDE